MEFCYSFLVLFFRIEATFSKLNSSNIVGPSLEKIQTVFLLVPQQVQMMFVQFTKAPVACKCGGSVCQMPCEHHLHIHWQVYEVTHGQCQRFHTIRSVGMLRIHAKPRLSPNLPAASTNRGQVCMSWWILACTLYKQEPSSHLLWWWGISSLMKSIKCVQARSSLSCHRISVSTDSRRIDKNSIWRLTSWWWNDVCCWIDGLLKNILPPSQNNTVICLIWLF